MLWPITQTNQRIKTLERLIWDEVIKDGWRTEMFHLTIHWGHIIFYGESCPLCCFLCKLDKSRDVCSNSQRAETQAFLSANVFTWTPPTALEWLPLFHARLHVLHSNLRWVLPEVFRDSVPSWVSLVLYILVTESTLCIALGQITL